MGGLEDAAHAAVAEQAHKPVLVVDELADLRAHGLRRRGGR
jgi:hypothetical protein